MRVLIGCERSGVVRDAFNARGHNAISCNTEPSDVGGPHYQGDVRDLLCEQWDLAVFHPPCTYLSVSGMHWTTRRLRDPVVTEDALAFVQLLMRGMLACIAIENPVSIISSRIRKPDQIIQPWMFGHGETKATCLWLKNLPLLVPSNIVEGREARVHRMPQAFYYL